MKPYQIELIETPKTTYYKVDGARVPRVSTILDKKSANIGWWLVKITVDAFRNEMLGSIGKEITVRAAWINTLCDIASRAAIKKRDEAGRLGTRVHSAIEKRLKGQTVTPLDMKVVDAMAQFSKWWISSGYTTIAIEMKLASKKLGYAGTTDLVVRDEKGRVGILDIKTGFIDNKCAVQMAAYGIAYKEMTGNEVEFYTIVSIPVKKEDFELKAIPVTDIKRATKQWKALLEVYKTDLGKSMLDLNGEEK